MDGARQQGDAAVDATALEVHGLAFPAIVEPEFFPEAGDDLLDRFAGGRRGQGVRVLEIDVGHPGIVGKITGVNEISLHAPGTRIDALPLATGRHSIGRAEDGGLEMRDQVDGARVCLCVDRRGVWLAVGEGVRGVHVNGRPVQRQALLRIGDCIHVDGHEIVLARGNSGSRESELPDRGLPRSDAERSDPRVVLRGIGGRHHGRSFTLDRARVVGSGADADIRIDDPAFAPRHARIGVQGGGVVLQALGEEACTVNGRRMREAMLQPGDQVVFDDHHRFVVEAPLANLGELPMEHSPEMVVVAPRERASAWRLPWLLLAAALLAAALSGLLLL